jgi:acetyl-CoA acetyltransferase
MRSMEPVAVVGWYAQTWKDGVRSCRLEEIVFDAARGALSTAGVSRDDLDGVVLACHDELDGRVISSMLTSAPSGALLKDEVRVTDSSLHGVVLGSMRVQSGFFNTVLVVSWSVTSGTPLHEVQLTALDPFVERPVGAIDPVATALHANAYVWRFGVSVGELDARARAKWGEAGVDPSLVDLETFVSTPLRRGHFAPLVDGVAAVVLVSPSVVECRAFRRPPIWIKGMAWGIDSYALGRRALGEWAVLRKVTADALARARLTLGDLEFVEVDDASVIHEALSVEAIGAAPAGKALSCVGRPSGMPRVQLGTNAFRGYPLFCSGLWRLVQALDQMANGSLPGTGLVHGTYGRAGQGHVALVLSREAGVKDDC